MFSEDFCRSVYIYVKYIYIVWASCMVSRLHVFISHAVQRSLAPLQHFYCIVLLSLPPSFFSLLPSFSFTFVSPSTYLLHSLLSSFSFSQYTFLTELGDDNCTWSLPVIGPLAFLQCYYCTHPLSTNGYIHYKLIIFGFNTTIENTELYMHLQRTIQ